MNTKLLLAASISAACAPRRIITRGVIDMATSQVIESESYDYFGPMALADEAPALDVITKSIEKITQLAQSSGVKIDKEIGEIKQYRTDTDARILDLEQKVAKSVRSGGNRGAGGAMNFGALLAADPKIEQLRKNETRLIHLTQKGSLAMLCKSVLVSTGTSGTSPEDGFPTPTEFIAPVPSQAPGRKLQVLQALPHLTVNAGTVIVPQVTSTTDGSAVQEFQGGNKGESTMSVHGAALPLATVATVLNASTQLLDDVSALPTFLQAWLSFFVLRKYENLIISGSGSASDGHITGLLNAGTAFTSGEAKNADKIADAIFTALPSYGYGADLVILNSADYLGIIAERATTGQFVNPSGWSAGGPGTLWGVRAVSTPGLAQGHAIVLDSQLVNILDRMEIQFAIGWVNEQFLQNLFSYRAELRGQLAVGDPHAVQVVALA
jgi:HK97 family phage major capsid protein